MLEDMRPQGSTSTVQPEFCAAARCAELLHFAGGLPWVAGLAVACESFCRSFEPEGWQRSRSKIAATAAGGDRR